MSDTPRTDAEVALFGTDFFEAVPSWLSRTLERELAAVTAERDRMRPVVEAAQKWRHAPMDSVAETNALNMIVLSVSTYEAATCPSATEMP